MIEAEESNNNKAETIPAAAKDSNPETPSKAADDMDLERQSEADASERHGHKELERVNNDSPRDSALLKTDELRSKRSKVVVDREKTCPFLIRMWVNTDGEYDVAELGRNGLPESDEYHMYTWKDATLRELASLLTADFDAAKSRNAKISFRFISRTAARLCTYRTTPLGTIFNFRSSYDDTKTLSSLKFTTGDALVVSIQPAEPSRGPHRDRGDFGSSRRSDGFGSLPPSRRKSEGGNGRFEPYSNRRQGRGTFDRDRLSRF
ncbi:Sin3 associated polypeptide p18-domain-containing protein [Phlyctochytrium arcticum]|nr:Sin3 associated polypeptide p18-domain-containing protein [Phlyctochytrium arcticum]